MSSALWLLEAKAFATEDRSPAATTIKYWLKPGRLVHQAWRRAEPPQQLCFTTHVPYQPPPAAARLLRSYVIGKPKHSDIAIDEDKSISRKHGGLVVPAAGEREGDGAPYVLLTGGAACCRLVLWSSIETVLHADVRCRTCASAAWAAPRQLRQLGMERNTRGKCNTRMLAPLPPHLSHSHSLRRCTDTSKYGTALCQDGSFDEKKTQKLASGCAPTRVDSGWMIKFGFKSPFKAVQQVWERSWRVYREKQRTTDGKESTHDTLVCSSFWPAAVGLGRGCPHSTQHQPLVFLCPDRTGCCTSAARSDRARTRRF